VSGQSQYVLQYQRLALHTVALYFMLIDANNYNSDRLKALCPQLLHMSVAGTEVPMCGAAGSVAKLIWCSVKVCPVAGNDGAICAPAKASGARAVRAFYVGDRHLLIGNVVRATAEGRKG
jgi:hypothetical protein